MRAIIEDHLPELPVSDLPATVLEAADHRRAKDKLPSAKTLAGLLPYTDFADSFEILSPRRVSLPDELKMSVDILAAAFERLVRIRNQVAHSRPMRLDDTAFVADESNRMVSTAPEAWETLAETMRRISDNPAYVLGLTPTWKPNEQTGTPFHNLPIPEFDETGFFGRRDELRKLKKLVKGNYPVVSVLGTGGIGKTALTVLAAYELVDDPDQPFEAVVWVTAKSAVLTATSIEQISGAIRDSLGLFSEAAHVLGGQEGADPIAELSSYMETFRVLLILDNLETVLDPLLREFLSDIPMGSKVIITSRISLGMLDNPISLGPLSSDDAINLLYALCRARGVNQLKGLPREDVAAFAEQMGGHPSYIRWFVAGLQAGRRPEDLLGDSGLILDYCMSNVYDYLDRASKEALGAFQVIPGPKNMAEMAYLNDFTGEEVERVLLALLTTNFVSMSSRSKGGGTLDSTYFLSEFAKDYLDRWHPVERDQRLIILTRNQELKDHGAAFSFEMASNPYSPETITVRGFEDAYVARILKEAVRSSDEESLRLCAEAQKLAPHYSEAYRMEGYLRARMLDGNGAHQAYERAVALSETASTRFHFGSFLLDEGVDLRRSLAVFQEAARIDPSSPEIASQISWVHYLLRDWPLALGASEQVLKLPSASFEQRMAAAIIGLRSACIRVEQDIECERYDKALEFAEDAIALCESTGPDCLAGEAADLLRLLMAILNANLTKLRGYLRQNASRDTERVQMLIDAAEPRKSRSIGRIVRLVHDKGFGFVGAEPVDYFLHVYELIERDMWEDLREGERCSFEPAMVDERWRATEVRILRL